MATNNWKKLGLIPRVLDLKWRVEEKGVEVKVNKIIDLVDQLTKNEDKVSIIGISAGGSAAINAYFQRKTKIYRLINICGRVRKGDGIFVSFDLSTKSSPAFRESVLKAEKLIENLKEDDKKKIMTVRPLFDELVPVKTMTIKGAKNIQIPSIEHTLSIYLSLTIFQKKLLGFLKS